MTFKIKAGINVGNVNVIDTNARYQQVLGVPNTQPTLNLDFINNPSLESRSTISRTSNGTFVDARGLVATASSNTARFECANGLPRGLLIENQRSNLAIYSEDFTFSSYVKNGSSTVIPYATIAPDGSLTGALWTSSGSVGSGFYRFVASLSTATQYTQSIYIKHIRGATLINIGCDANPVAAAVTFNASTGVITATGANVTYSTVTNVGNGWYRVSVTFTSTATNPSFICYSGSAGAMSWATWGFQTEAGPNPTSYIPSSTTFTSRASLASYQDSTDNLIKYAGVNLLTDSEGPLSGSVAGGITATDNVLLSPIGTLKGTLIDITSPLSHAVGRNVTVSPSTQYTFSFYVQRGTATAMSYSVYNNTGSADIVASTNYFSSTTAVGWTRVSVTFTTPLGCTQVRVYPARDGTSAGTFGVWGLQVEEGPSATLYAITTAAASGAARPVYNPLTRINSKILTEPAATNLMLKSVLDASGWAYGAEVAINSATAPDGTTTAATLTVPASVTYNSAFYNTGSTVTAATQYTWSTYVKLGTLVAADYKFAMYDLTNSNMIGINLVPTITPVTYEWRRITYTFTTPAGCVSVRPYYYRNDSTGAGGTVFLWGGQLELGAYPTSYIPTIGSSVTRAADTFSTATVTRSGDYVTLPIANWFNNIEGTFVVDLDASNWMSTPFIVLGNAAEYVTGRGLNGVGTWNGTTAVDANPVTGANVASGVIAAVAYNSAGRAVAVNGVAPTTGSGAFSNSSVIYLGSLGSVGTRAIDGRIREVSFYPFAASNTQLQALTRL